MGDNQITASEMASRLQEQESMISDLETELSSLQAEFEVERTNHMRQLEEVKIVLKDKESLIGDLDDQLRQVGFLLDPLSYIGRVSDSVCVCVCVCVFPVIPVR